MQDYYICPQCDDFDIVTDGSLAMNGSGVLHLYFICQKCQYIALEDELEAYLESDYS